jgi:hypothetical protein
MKPKLMSKDGDKMGKNLMFYFPNNDPSRALCGCLTKNAMIKDNADIFVVISQTKGKRMTEVKAFDKNGKLLDSGHYLNDAEKKGVLDLNKILEGLINE